MHKNFFISTPIKKDEYGKDVYVFTLKIKNKIIFANNMVLGTWTIREYREQWINALQRLRTEDISCIVQAYVHILSSNYTGVTMFTLFRSGLTLYIQYKALMSDSDQRLLREKEFNIQTCYEFITPIRTHNEYGQELLVWSCNYDPQEIDQLIAELKK
ncbi:hypothetical protein KJZ61_04455 [Candidatus Dependentiae bacterium]|nr:hypothetical protein [Candidatus Dependentiae bacterium]